MIRTLAALLLCFVGSGFAQGVFEDLVPKSAIKFSPLHLINFYPTAQVAYEHQLYKSLTAQLDAGYVLPLGERSQRFTNKRGFKSKLEFRYYLDAAERHINYVSVEPYYYRINFDRWAVGAPECIDASCQSQFVRKYNFKMLYREHGFSAKFGGLIYLRGAFLFDYNVGVTLRMVDYDSSLPELFPPARQSWIFEPNEEDRQAAAPHLGIRFVYRIK
ncbi:MAG TPA: hypothetical protein VD927_08255 [Chryseosolibacter sp.]|nr:hypothetical protein [Chryseosolibacter sp.]